MPQQTYDPNEVSVAFDGTTLVQFAKGTFISVERDSDAFADEVGANGDVVRIKSADKRGSVKLTLMKASPSNDTLMGQALTDEATALATGSLIVRDARGTSIHHSATAWVKRIPKADYGTEHSNVEWEFRCAELDHYVGGTLSL